MKHPTLSVIITAHAEGFLAHKTIMSVQEALQKLSTKDSYEIIIHIDNGTAGTKKYYSRYKAQKDFTIYSNNFGDPGLSRNFAAAHAHGEYLTFLDGDDLISPNWYAAALKLLRSHQEPVLVHPNAVLLFGPDITPHLIMQTDSGSKEEDAVILLGENRWALPVMGKREIFISHPYIATENGYGYEDYHFNVETVNDGIKHIVAPQTVLFYRRDLYKSVLLNSDSGGDVQPFSELFDVENPNLDAIIAKYRPDLLPPPPPPHHSLAYRALRKSYHVIFRPQPPQEEPSLPPDVPDFILKAWRSINHIENLLYPTSENLQHLAHFDEFQNLPCSIAYYKLMSQIQKPDYLFMLSHQNNPKLNSAVSSQIATLRKQDPHAHIAIVLTAPAPHNLHSPEWDNVDILDYASTARNLPPHLQDRLLTRLLIQSRCRKIYFCNSDPCFRWIKQHASAAKTLPLELMFLPEKQDELIIDYLDRYATSLIGSVKKIHISSASTADTETKYGIPSSKINML